MTDPSTQLQSRTAFQRLYGEAEAYYRRVLRPGSGVPNSAIDLTVSPDGKLAAFAGAVVERLDGPPRYHIFLLDLQSGHLQKIDNGGTELTPCFSPDGRFLAFRSDRARPGDFQLHLMELQTNHVTATPAVPGWLEYMEYSPDGSHILLGVAGVNVDVAGVQGGKRVRLGASSESETWRPDVDAREDASRRRGVWLFNTTTGRLTCVTPRALNVWESCWCGNNALAVIGSSGAEEADWYHSELVLVRVPSQEVLVVYRPRDQIGCISASAQGSSLAFVEASCSDRLLVAGQLRVLDVVTGHSFAPQTNSIDVTFTRWRGAEQLLIAGVRGLESVVADLHLGVNDIQEHWASETETCLNSFYPYAAPVPGTIDECLLGIVSHLQPMRVVRLKGSTPRTLLSFAHEGTAWLEKKFRAVRTYRWEAPDGLKLGGWLMEGSRSRPAPLLMEVHGGPIWRWSPLYLGRSAYYGMLADRGYAFFWPNPRGSTGRGQDFSRAVIGDMGGADARDCLAGVEHLVKEQVADGTRLAVMGLSYGGFMAAWLVTQDSRFTAAVSVCPVTDWVSLHLTSNTPTWDREYLGSQYMDTRGAYYTRSPVRWAHQARTPTLNVCGAQDRCTPPTQAREFYQALVEHGVESELVMYPQEGHGIRSFPAAIDYSARVVEWLTRHASKGA